MLVEHKEAWVPTSNQGWIFLSLLIVLLHLFVRLFVSMYDMVHKKLCDMFANVHEHFA